MEIIIIVLRTVLIYFVILVVMRIMGKREIGKLSVFDLVVSIMIAELAVISLESSDIPMIYSLAPILVLMVTQVMLAYFSLKSRRIRELVDGKPSILIEHGQIREQELKKQRYNIDDLLLQLRENRIHSISQVEFAILEPSGKLTIMPKEKEQCVTKKDMHLPVDEEYTLPFILIKDGEIQEDALNKLNRSHFWLRSEMKKRTGSTEIKNISFCSMDYKGNWFIDMKD